MYYTVINARYVRDFTIWAKFADGSEGEIDLADELWGPIFEPLKDVNYFRNFSVAEYGTICWPNGANVAPEFLHEKLHVQDQLRPRVSLPLHGKERESDEPRRRVRRRTPLRHH